MVSNLSDTFDVLCKHAYETDNLRADVHNMLKKGVRHDSRIVLADCLERAGQLINDGRAYVPVFNALRLRLIQLHHEIQLVRHPR